MPLDDALALARSREKAHLQDLEAYLRIPSISTDSEYADDVRRGAAWAAQKMRDAGLDDVTVHETPRHPIVTASWLGAGAEQPTILVYGHYDVQPPDPLDKWTSPAFEPTIRDGKIYARGATDDKGQNLVHMEALAAILEADGALPVNVKIILEGEEEEGSPSLEPFVESHQDLLAADAVVVSDSPMWDLGRPALGTGLRGIAYMQIDVQGPNRDLHSGQYGGAVRNPANALATILAGLRDADGRVTLPGFYDDVVEPTEAERAEWRELGESDEDLMADLGVDALPGEAGWSSLERRWARPTLDVNGVWGGYQGEGSKTVIPSEAHAKVSMRLVANQDPLAVAAAFRARVAELAPSGVKVTVVDHQHARPVLVTTDDPAVQAASRALEATFGVAPLLTREGGTIPVVATFADILGAPTVLMGLGLPTENLHSPDEHFHLENFHQGIQASIRLWYELARL